MNRSVGLDRTYVLGSYRNLKISDYISSIPEHIFLNPEAMKALATLQWTRLDSVYYDYIKNSPTFVEGITTEEAMVQIEEIQSTSFEKLMQAVASTVQEKYPEEEEEEN